MKNIRTVDAETVEVIVKVPATLYKFQKWNPSTEEWEDQNTKAQRLGITDFGVEDGFYEVIEIKEV